MCERFLYSVTTALPREQVWKIFGDIQNWPRISDVYVNLTWSGLPWVPGSSVVGEIKYPVNVPFRYVVESCEAASCVKYLAHSKEIGFATHRTIEMEATKAGTLIKVNAYAVGEPSLPIPGGSVGFLKMLTERWFQDFARFCDQQARAVDLVLVK